MAWRISSWCAVALLAAASLQTAQAKRVASPAPASSVQDSLCERSVSAADNSASDGNALSGSRWLISYKTQGSLRAAMCSGCCQVGACSMRTPMTEHRTTTAGKARALCAAALQ